MSYVTTNNNTIWGNAFSAEMRGLWQDIPYVVDNPTEIDNLSAYRMVTAFYKASSIAVNDRQKALKALMYATEFDTSDDGWVNQTDLSFNSDSNIPKIADKLNVLYDNPPLRVFSDEDLLNVAYNELYDKSNINGFMQKASEAVWLCKIIAVSATLQDNIVVPFFLTPDEFRLCYNPDGSVKSIMYINIDNVNNILESHTYTVEEHTITYRNLLDTADKNFHKRPFTEINEAGIIPFIFMTNSSRPNNGYFTGGQVVLTMKQLEINQTSLLARVNRSYNGAPLLIAWNTGLDALDRRPGRFSLIDEKDEDHEGRIEIVDPGDTYSNLMNATEEMTKRMEINTGIPLSMVSIDAVTVESGLAKSIDQEPLNEARRKEIPFYLDNERELLRLISVIINIGIDSSKLQIMYDEPTILQEPEVERAFDDSLLKDGLIPISGYVHKWGIGFEGLNEEEIAALINARKETLNGITTDILPQDEDTEQD